MRECIRCGRNRALRFFQGSRGRVCSTCRAAARSSAAHARRIKATYGITGAEYDALLLAQDGHCAACPGVRRYRLCVDHDHKVERERGSRASVRGLLCRRCNKLLRDCRDNPELLEALAHYLRHWPSKGVIK